MAFEEEIRAVLADHANRSVSTDDPWSVIRRRVRKRKPPSRIAAALVAIIVSAVSLGLLWSAFRPGQQAGRTSPGQTSTVLPAVNARVAATVHVGAFPGPIAVGTLAIWVGQPAQSPQAPDVVSEIDSSTNEVIATIPVDGSPDAIAVSGNSVWVATEANGGEVVRIDAGTGTVTATIPSAGGFLVASPNAVWALGGPRTIVRIDPATNEVVARIPLDLPADHVLTGGLVFSGDAVWTLDTDQKGVGASDAVRVDAVDNSVSVVDVNADAGVLAGGEGVVWLSGGNEAIEIDATTSEVLEAVSLPTGFSPFAVSGGRVWFVTNLSDGSFDVEGLNPNTRQVDASVTVGSFSPATLHPVSGSANPSGDTLWLSEYQHDATRVDINSP
jgi:YVTN family beta-propeller protein